MKSVAKNLIIDIIIAVVLAAIVLFFIRPTIVQQSSMENTLKENDYVIMSKQAYRSKSPQYGDIIIFKSALKDSSGKDKLLIKRVIGVEGDTITIKDGYVYRNGEKLQEPYLKDGDGSTIGTITNQKVESGKVFAMGDNRVVSVDSRYEEVGQVKVSDIVGKAVFRLFPISKFGKL